MARRLLYQRAKHKSTRKQETTELYDLAIAPPPYADIPAPQDNDGLYSHTHHGQHNTTTGTITVVIVEAFAAIVTVGIVTIVEDMVVALVLVTWGLAAMVTVGIVTIVEDVIVALVLVT